MSPENLITDNARLRAENARLSANSDALCNALVSIPWRHGDRFVIEDDGELDGATGEVLKIDGEQAIVLLDTGEVVDVPTGWLNRPV